MIYTVINATRNTTLGQEIILAQSSADRRAGLLKQDSLEESGGLWIAPCEAIHTFFMGFPIDVLFLDKQKRVLKVRAELRPWRMSACLVAQSVLELPSGMAARTLTEVGDQLEFKSAD